MNLKKDEVSEWVKEMEKVLTDPIYDATMDFYSNVYPNAKINSGIVVSIFEAGIEYQKQQSKNKEK